MRFWGLAQGWKGVQVAKLIGSRGKSTWCTVMHLLLCRWTLHYCHFMQALLNINFLVKTHCHSVNNCILQCFVCKSVSKEVRLSREWWGTSAGCELPVNTVIDWSSDSDIVPHSHHFCAHFFLSILRQSDILMSFASKYSLYMHIGWQFTKRSRRSWQSDVSSCW